MVLEKTLKSRNSLDSRLLRVFARGCMQESMQPLDCMEIQPVPILKETSPGFSLEGLMLKLKLQYFDSFEKTLLLGKIEGRRDDRE